MPIQIWICNYLKIKDVFCDLHSVIRHMEVKISAFTREVLIDRIPDKKKYYRLSNRITDFGMWVTTLQWVSDVGMPPRMASLSAPKLVYDVLIRFLTWKKKKKGFSRGILTYILVCCN